MSEDVNRKKTTFIIREDLLKKAEKLGLLGRNLSEYVEKLLEKFLPLYEQSAKKLEYAVWGLAHNLTPGVGFEPTTPEGSGLAVELKIKWEDIEEYLELRKDERGWSIKHYAEEERRLRDFFNITQGVINTDSITEYIKAIRFYSKKRDYANTVVRFLEWFSKRKRVNLSNEIELLRSVPRPKKEKKLYADSDRFTLTLDDIRKTLKLLIDRGNYRVASLVILMASTGIRPEEACTVTKKGM
ncbi:hypothetical protein, partial [Archaeoglobus sp.]